MCHCRRCANEYPIIGHYDRGGCDPVDHRGGCSGTVSCAVSWHVSPTYPRCRAYVFAVLVVTVRSTDNLLTYLVLLIYVVRNVQLTSELMWVMVTHSSETPTALLLLRAVL